MAEADKAIILTLQLNIVWNITPNFGKSIKSAIWLHVQKAIIKYNKIIRIMHNLQHACYFTIPLSFSLYFVVQRASNRGLYAASWPLQLYVYLPPVHTFPQLLPHKIPGECYLYSGGNVKACHFIAKLNFYNSNNLWNNKKKKKKYYTYFKIHREHFPVINNVNMNTSAVECGQYNIDLTFWDTVIGYRCSFY